MNLSTSSISLQSYTEQTEIASESVSRRSLCSPNWKGSATTAGMHWAAWMVHYCVHAEAYLTGPSGRARRHMLEISGGVVSASSDCQR